MTHKTLDEYLKQTTPTTTKQHTTKPKYKITGFYKETQFQETPIGKIPKQWKIVKLGSLFTFRNGKRPSRILENDMVPIYGANGIMGYTNTALLDRDYVIIIGRVGASGKVHLARGKIWVSDNAIYSESYDRNRIYPIFAYFFLSFINLERYASKTTHPIIKQSFLKELEIPLPPLEEQWGIAEVLSSVDEAIEATERLIGRLERLKRGLMQELLTKGIGHREYKQTQIGRIPKEWQVVKLGDVAKIDTKAVTPKPGVKYYYIGLEDIESDTGRLLKHPEDLIDGSEIRSTKYYFTANHVLYGKLRPYLNKVTLPPRDGICSTDILPILPNTRAILREYLAYVLLHPRFVSYATARMRGTNHPRVNPREILRYEFPLPPIDEQKIIVETLLVLNKWIETEKRRKEKLERLKRGLMELLLTGRVRVRVERLDGEENLPGSGGGAGS
ncbi:MAG: restriction endonuclease subunit S [Desulfurococcales archaeon]|nr:restriction endonuclease subunit S [Desulfurococcales archaeon]